MNREQFENTILPMQDRIYRYSASILGDLSAAKDVVQEVFLKLWKGREKLDEIKNIEAWCITITKNTCFDRLQSPKNKSVGLEGVSLGLFAGGATDEKTEEEDLLGYLETLVKELPELQQNIFRMRDLMGYSNKEIQSLLELTDNQVKVNLCRARQKLKTALIKRMNYGVTN